MENSQSSVEIVVLDKLPFAGLSRNGVISPISSFEKRIGYNDKLWTTPMARLGTARGPQAKRYKAVGRSIDLDDAVAHFEGGGAPAGVTARPRGVVLWPTPTARDGKSGPGTSAKREGGMNLRTAVIERREIFPTPTVQDSANNGGPAQMKRNSLPLNAHVGGSLNPFWVEWLMGFAPDWTTT